MRRRTGGYQVRANRGLIYAYPVDGKQSLRPSGDPEKDAPEELREDHFSTARLNLPKTREEQAKEDRETLRRFPDFASWLPHYAYWDNIRFRDQPQKSKGNKRSRKIKRALELLEEKADLS